MSEHKLTVMYIVGEDSSTSIPLEVAGFMRDGHVRMITAAYYDHMVGGAKAFDVSVIRIGAKSRIDPRGPFRLYACIAHIQPDVVHIHHTVSAFWGALIGKLAGGAKIVRTEHNDHRFSNLGQNIINFCCQALSDRVLCNSEETYHNLRPWEKWIVGNNFEVVYNGVDVNRIDQAIRKKEEVRQMLGVRKDEVVIGSVGRLIEVKNYNTLLHAMPRVIDEFPNARLVLVGDGLLRAHLEKVAHDLELSDRIIFVGRIDRDSVYSFLHAIDLYVVPSLAEGFCNAAVEAMAACNPVVSSDISTLREVIGDVATYVDPTQPDDIARGIIELVSRGPKAWYDQGRACRERAVRNYSVEQTARAYVRNYFRVVGRTPPEL